MSTRSELLAAIATTIKDYRKGEVEEPTPDYVDHWVCQFPSEVQIPLLKEVGHILGTTYLSKKFVSDFFAHQIQHKKLTGPDPCAFWRNANFLNIQQHGESQREILQVFEDSLDAQCGIGLDDCESEAGPYFYLDDILFSGGRIGTDLKTWILNDAPGVATVNILVIGTHRLGEWQCLEGLKKVAKEAGKSIDFHCWAAIRIENRKYYKDSSEVLWPALVPDDKDLAAYMALETRFPFSPRRVGGKLENNVFSGEDGRQLVERELLLAGVKIREKCQNPKTVMRPLGFGHFGLGFGATIVTYRNCPNNCPLALWWGDPSVKSGAFAWHPLLPRKTYAQSFDLSAFDIDF